MVERLEPGPIQLVRLDHEELLLIEALDGVFLFLRLFDRNRKTMLRITAGIRHKSTDSMSVGPCTCACPQPDFRACGSGTGQASCSVHTCPPSVGSDSKRETAIEVPKGV